MSPTESSLDYIDYPSIRFPSDSITVADIRRVHPDRFDIEGGGRFRQATADPTFHLNSILYLERLVARAAYEKVLGKPGDIIFDRGLERDGG